MTMILVDVALDPEEADKLLHDALTGISHTTLRVDKVGEIASDDCGYPWKRIKITDESNVAEMEEGTPVYGEYL
jgi:hypothetical protein